jgi:hypothetical protein
LHDIDCDTGSGASRPLRTDRPPPLLPPPLLLLLLLHPPLGEMHPAQVPSATGTYLLE